MGYPSRDHRQERRFLFRKNKLRNYGAKTFTIFFEKIRGGRTLFLQNKRGEVFFRPMRLDFHRFPKAGLGRNKIAGQRPFFGIKWANTFRKR